METIKEVPTFQLISETEFKKTEMNIIETTYNYQDLLEKERILVQDIDILQVQLTSIRNNINKAKELGIK